ncbi:hypothetical protein Nepgr_024696 [Nepenthes gracilis]|uniref:Homeobox domain-containing protein n=1 Tax=Nepenthes gracilis TaxID=150966 RepID=A0AAD3T4M2_NEPGR|nr:hypothetical protein Nepgr_024696 [Nepenthes gracilis]
MEDEPQDPNKNHSGSPSMYGPAPDQRSEPVRSRWTPKPEQILILESIFNSGMVNPPKDETVRIRKLLEKFGTVGDANVFYWFQNRRSRSRRRQRQLQASLLVEQPLPPPPQTVDTDDIGSGEQLLYHHQSCSGLINTPSHVDVPSTSCLVDPSSASFDDSGGNDLLAGQTGMPETVDSSASAPLVFPSDSSILDYQSAGIITVFINGVAMQVPGAAFDMKAMLGQDAVLVHSSGVPVPVDHSGISLHPLQPGESYFLRDGLLPFPNPDASFLERPKLLDGSLHDPSAGHGDWCRSTPCNGPVEVMEPEPLTIATATAHTVVPALARLIPREIQAIPASASFVDSASSRFQSDEAQLFPKSSWAEVV